MAKKAIGNIGMSRIKAKNTQPEILVRKYLFAKGLRFRIHAGGLPGKPDIVLKRYNAIVLVNGCFWHAHNGCRYKKIPKNNSAFWEDKISKTVARDEANLQALHNLGWRVYIVWECELHKNTIAATLEKLYADITGSC